MKKEIKDDILEYIENKEYIANKYIVKCFTVTMIVYSKYIKYICYRPGIND